MAGSSPADSVNPSDTPGGLDPSADDPATDDPYRWLEDITGEAALAWVNDRNTEATDELTGTTRFTELRDQILQMLDSDAKIPYVTRRGEYRYNYWQDATNPKGLWRRTTLEQYRTDNPEWDVLLDLDQLAEQEGENWVWAGARVLRPDYTRALIELSRGGADATVVREFDLTTREFVSGGFELPEAKTHVGWIDIDHIYVGTDFGPGTMTAASFPRIAKLWRRGTPLSEAETIFEGEDSDITVVAVHDHTPGYERDFVRRAVEFFRGELYHRLPDGRLRRIEIPDDAMASVERDWLLVELRSDWTVGGQTHPAGSLLVAEFDSFMAGGRELRRLFTPDAHTSLAGYSWTRNHLILNLMHDVTSRLRVLTPRSDGGWDERGLTGFPALSTTTAGGTDPDTDDEYALHVTGFLNPSTFSLGVVGTDHVEQLKQQPDFFDTAGLRVDQHFATSDDGTQVPYFVVGPDGPVPDGGRPTILYGYGGFEISLQPGYSGGIGRGWLSRGGCYVVANIRGGGEYGPAWHEAGLKQNRHLVYEDFAAVARDLTTRGITTPARLGALGGSNGGLLMGVMLTWYPELFGAIVSKVPLSDMRRYHQLLAGATWIAEYGDPDEEEVWSYLQHFSPYHQVRTDVSYPPILLTTSTRDDRVHPAHARKMVARLRELGQDVTYYENIEGGHGGAADNKQHAFMAALAYEFFVDRLTRRCL